MNLHIMNVVFYKKKRNDWLVRSRTLLDQKKNKIKKMNFHTVEERSVPFPKKE